MSLSSTYTNKILAYTDDKQIRKMVKEDMLAGIVDEAVVLTKEGVLGLKHCCMDYAKDPKISDTNRKIFYDVVEEVEKRSLAELEFDISKISFEELEAETEHGEMNGVTAEYSPPGEDGPTGQYMGIEEFNGFEDEDYVDPYENLSEEELLQKLPPYFNKTNKQKKKFFKNLNHFFLNHIFLKIW